MAKVIWSPSSLEDIKLIYEFISRDSIHQANLFLDNVIKVVEKLADFPYSGRKIPEMSREDAREVIYGNYRIMYKIESDIIWITGIVHGARDWKP